jgi:hypothetical protein
MSTAREIRAKMRKRLAGVAMRLAEVQAKDDERFPPEYQLKRQLMRAELVREWQSIEGQGVAEMESWSGQAIAEAQRIYHSDPLGDAAAESRRVSENLEIAALAAPLIGQGRTMISNSLLPEARRFLALNLPDKARIYLEAAKRAGVTDSRLDQALSDTYDRTVPHRKRARALMDEQQLQRDLFDNDRVSLRLAHSVGDQVRASTEAKLLAARRGQDVPAGMLDGAYAEGQLHAAARDAGTAE